MRATCALLMIQIEMAFSRNSKVPDFTGYSVVLSSVIDGSGAIQTKEFHKWVADKNESRARIMKSERLYHEERANVKKKQKGDPKVGSHRRAEAEAVKTPRPLTDRRPCRAGSPGLPPAAG